MLLRETAAEFQAKMSRAGGRGGFTLRPHPTADLLGAILPSTPLIFNLVGIALTLPLWGACLGRFASLGALQWRASEPAYFAFTRELDALPSLRRLSAATALGSVLLCALGVSRLARAGGSVRSVLPSAAWPATLAPTRAHVRARAPNPHPRWGPSCSRRRGSCSCSSPPSMRCCASTGR